MSMFKLSENIARLRKEKKITQDVLAEFIGVTKASVSKWETEQCMPDILLLPCIAAFFDVTVDELIGYDPQMSPEQIQKTYIRFTAAFASEPFDKVIEEVRDMVKRYYSCYPLLLQICILYLNHAPLAGNTENMNAVFRETRLLCEHIIDDCKNAFIASDAVTLKAILDLQLGDSRDVVEALEQITDPTRFSHQNESLLIEAYRASGMKDKALDFIQVSIYLKVIYHIGLSVQYLMINCEDKGKCISTIKKTDALAQVYDIDRLHPNAMAQYNYQAALNYISYGDLESAVKRLDRYSQNVLTLINDDDCRLHGDKYFDRLDGFIGSLTLGSAPPRDMLLVKQSIIASFENPVFDILKENVDFQKIKNKIGGI